MANALLTSPAISGRLNAVHANSRIAGEIDSLGDYQQFSSVAEQGCAGQALADAMLQESLSGFGEWARTMPRYHTWILEQSLEH
jgi:hypothetical protein